jgi:hypothetical protein
MFGFPENGHGWAFYEYTAFCNGPSDVKSPRVIVASPSSRFCPWSTLRPPHCADGHRACNGFIASTVPATPDYDLKPPKTTASCEVVMARCETCGNGYDKAFQVSMGGTTHTFDSFECAIHALAPTCENCGIRIVGHGLEKDGTFFCCEHCAQAIGVSGLRDRVAAAA